MRTLLSRNPLHFILIFSLLIVSFPVRSSPLQWSFNHTETQSSQGLKQSLMTMLESNDVLPNGQIGIAALNMQTGERITLNGDTSFFMASTYKIAIATQLLTLVDQKKISLNQLIALKPRNFVPGSGILTKYFKDDQCSLSVLALLKLMLQESDNTATDILLQLAGGPSAVTKRLQELKITNMTVDRSTLEFTRDFFNIKLPSPEKQNYETLMSLYSKGTPDLEKFLNDTRDNTTPNAMVNLLETLYQGKALSTESTQLLFSIMSKKTEETGRIYYFLPGVKVVQKLGTGDQVVNDVGILYLPAQRGAIALAIFMKYVPSDQIVKDRLTALIAKTIYDYFLFQPTQTTTR